MSCVAVAQERFFIYSMPTRAAFYQEYYMLSIGLMSGTSMDGIDAALLQTDGKHAIVQLENIFLPYPAELKLLFKGMEFAVRQYEGNVAAAAQTFTAQLMTYLQTSLALTMPAADAQRRALNQFFHPSGAEITYTQLIHRSTELHAAAVRRLLILTGYSAQQIDVIGYHGQTLFHDPARRLSIQMGDGKYLAELTGIATVNNFRQDDVAAGGEGAPFAPLYHQALIVNAQLAPAAIINCGGIANISMVTGPDDSDVMGFDTGPGNCLLDQCVKHATNGAEHMDYDGRYALQGRTDHAVLAQLQASAIKHDFLRRSPPKSLDIGEVHAIPALQQLSLADACRTLAAFTAATIVEALYTFCPVVPTTIVLAGGGWHNPVLRSELDERVKQQFTSIIPVLLADTLGWNSQAMEAQLFAYLAVRDLRRVPSSRPAITRVPKPLLGGMLHLAQPSRATTAAKSFR